MTRTRLSGLVVLVAAALFLSGFQAGRCRNQGVASEQVQQADLQHAKGETRTERAATHDAAAAEARSAKQVRAAETAQLRTEVALLKQPLAEARTPATPLEERQDDLIGAQEAELAATRMELTETAAARDEYQAAAQAFRSEGEALRQALAHLPRDSKNAFLAGYNPVTKDALVGYTRQLIGPVEVGGMAVWQDRKPGAYALLIVRW